MTIHCYINRQSRQLHAWLILRMLEVINNSCTCNMGAYDLPDMHALNPQACGPQALGIHIRQILHAHVTTIVSSFKY